MTDRHQRDESALLRAEPTVERWMDEIYYLVSGTRESDILQIGGVHQYVIRLLADSTDRPKATSTFKLALRDFSQSWQPDEDPASIGAFFELVSAFTPPFGFGKILGYLAQWEEFPISKGKTREDQIFLNLKALLALEAYYTTPQANKDAVNDSGDDPGFNSYVHFLWQQLDKPEYRAHSLRRLLELRIVAPDDPIVAELIRIPQVLVEILQYTVSTRRHLLQDSAGYLLAHCLTASRREDADALYGVFKSTLQSLYCRLAHEDQWPAIILPNAEQIMLRLPSAAQSRYMEWRFRDAVESTEIEKIALAGA
jgi:hypothetical protein